MLTLIVEDDEDYAEIIGHALKRDGHDVVALTSVREGLKFASRKLPDLAVLDVMLPDGSGHDLCAGLRQLKPTLPVMFLSSLDRATDVIAGLNAGADDYLGKPFHPGELVARVRALTRRAYGESVGETEVCERVSGYGFEIDMTNRVATFQGEELSCTPTEVDILGQLVRYPGQALSHAYLTEKVWGYQNVSDATLLKGHVSSLRRKLQDAGGQADLVRTVHGVGYSFSPV